MVKDDPPVWQRLMESPYGDIRGPHDERLPPAVVAARERVQGSWRGLSVQVRLCRTVRRPTVRHSRTYENRYTNPGRRDGRVVVWTAGMSDRVAAGAEPLLRPGRGGTVHRRGEGAMRLIGLLGGMSWESTALYYRYMNEAVRSRLGGLHSARLLLASVDFHHVAEMQRLGQWDAAGLALADLAAALRAGGAELLVLCTNTMHKVAPAIEAAVPIPLLHIADATAAAIRAAGIGTVGLLATRFTMEQEFYVGRLRERHGLAVLVPDADDRTEVHRVIYDELCGGRILPTSRQFYMGVIDRLVGRGAQGIILGCTEIGMLIDPAELPVPAFDTTRLHAEEAVRVALADA